MGICWLLVHSKYADLRSEKNERNGRAIPVYEVCFTCLASRLGSVIELFQLSFAFQSSLLHSPPPKLTEATFTLIGDIDGTGNESPKISTNLGVCLCLTERIESANIAFMVHWIRHSILFFRPAKMTYKTNWTSY